MGALDELLVHDLLVSRYRVTYEEGEGTRPDFRLYEDDGAYVAAVEVATLFLREDWSAEQRRHAVVEDALNQRLILTTHSIQFEISRWDDSPKLRDMARWVERTLDDLSADPGALPLDESGTPEKIYSTRAVEIAFRFLPLPASYAVRSGDRIVLGGAAIGGLLNSAARLRAIDIDPVNEELYQRLMRIHGRQGNTDAVRATMRLLSNRLAEIGYSEPSQATQRVASRQLTSHHNSGGPSDKGQRPEAHSCAPTSPEPDRHAVRTNL